MKKHTPLNYAEYAKDNPKGYWFKMKLYGWGWVPVKWQGWMVVLAFIGILLLNSAYLNFNVPSGEEPTFIDLAIFFGVMIISVLILFWVCYKKGEKPRLRWG